MYILSLFYLNNNEHYASALSELSEGSAILSGYPELGKSIIQFVNEPESSYKGEYLGKIAGIDRKVERRITSTRQDLEKKLFSMGWIIKGTALIHKEDLQHVVYYE